MHAALVLVAAGAIAATPPAPTRWVTDEAGFLSPQTRAALDQRLESYERATGHQVIVWIGKSLGDGAALDEWSVRTFGAWKIGRQGLDDGIAMFVFAGDRKIDIEVGYGLEDKVPDAIASRIIRDVMTPKLRAGDRDGAVTAGTNALLTAIEGKPFAGSAIGAPMGGVQPAGAPQRRPMSPVEKVFAVIGLIALVIFCITHPRLALLLLWSIMARGGGGFGGGGGGGFGGGGGRSGGGGARGGW